jgi:hypothetical protein
MSDVAPSGKREKERMIFCDKINIKEIIVQNCNKSGDNISNCIEQRSDSEADRRLHA